MKWKGIKEVTMKKVVSCSVFIFFFFFQKGNNNNNNINGKTII